MLYILNLHICTNISIKLENQTKHSSDTILRLQCKVLNICIYNLKVSQNYSPMSHAMHYEKQVGQVSYCTF